MKKKLITILAMLAIGATFAMAAQTVGGTADSPTYTSSNTAVNDTDTATVVAVQGDEAFSFIFEAQDATGWTAADGKEVYDSWTPRTDFTASFRARVMSGTSNTNTSLALTIQVGNLTRVDTETGVTPYDTGNPTIGARSLGTDSILSLSQGSVTTSTASVSVEDTITLAKNINFGTDEVKNSVYFDVTYDGDDEAPAGRYESVVSLNFVTT